MTVNQFRRAYALAMSAVDLSKWDMSLLDGFGLPNFQPVVVALEAVARCIRWQVCQWNGGIDADALQECHCFFVYPSQRVQVLEM